MPIVRSRILEQAQTNVLTKSRRRCCLCFWLDGIDEVVKGQIAHLDQDSSNSRESNLAFLCFRHHDEFDSTPRQSKGLRKDEVKHWRDELHKEMAYRFRDTTSESYRRQEEFTYVEEKMPDLLACLQAGLALKPLARLMCLGLAHGHLSAEVQFIEVTFGKVPLLREKVKILCNYQLLSHDEADFYYLSESLVRYLETRNEE